MGKNTINITGALVFLNNDYLANTHLVYIIAILPSTTYTNSFQLILCENKLV